MFTKEEAMAYIKDVFGINYITFYSRSDRFDVLNEILYQHHQISFNSLVLLADPVENRHRPSLDDVKLAGRTKEGGLCYTLNVFLFHLLRALEYEVYLNMCHVVAECENNHVLVVLRNLLKDGDTYLAEVGCANPTFKAVCLDFEAESQVIHQANLVYKFDKVSGKIRRLHKQKDETFDVVYEFKLNPTSKVESVYKYFDYVFENVDALRFHKVFLAKKFEKGEIISIVNHTLTHVAKNGDTSKSELADEIEVQDSLRKYFPEIRESVVKKAYANWKLSQ